jgi:flagellar biosynthesis/type III secretory pathway protein FliH
VISLSRVIRTPDVATATELFAGSEPRFYDDDVRASIDAEIARAFEAGRREGFTAGRADTVGAVQRLERALAAALMDASRLRDAAVDDTLTAALQVAEYVVGAAVVDAAGPLAERINTAATLVDDHQATVYVSPSDWDVVAPILTLPAGMRVERDPSIRPGEARITGPWASVELTRDAALERAREVLS